MSNQSYNACKMDIDEFADTVKDAPQQRTPGWYDMRQTTFGGSEVANIIDPNHPYKGLSGLIKEKIGLSKFYGNIHTRWGTLFEYVTKEWIERVLCMLSPIVELGSVEGPIPRQRYSPDGVGIVKLKVNGNNDTAENDEKEESINNYDYYKVLFEFKAPSRTIPDGNIPSHYLPQVQTGLMNIPAVDLAIFVNNCYRKCSLFDLSFDCGYDTDFHNGDVKKKAAFLTTKPPLACGIICFYQTDKQYRDVVKALGYDDSVYESDNDLTIDEILDINYNDLSQNNANVYKDSDADLLMNSCYANAYDEAHIVGIDFGVESNDNIERLFELYSSGHIQASFMPMFINGEQVKTLPMLQMHDLYQNADQTTNEEISGIMHNQFEHYYNTCQENGWKPIGYLPWKLLLSDIIPVLRDETWQSQVEPYINQALDTLDTILQSDNVEDAYYTYFPNKTDLTNEDCDMAAFMKS